MVDDGGHYDQVFFDRQIAGSTRSASVILRPIFEWLRPRAVVDIGCGAGTWLAVAKDLGAESVLGVDGSYIDRSQLRIQPSEFLELDIEQEGLDRAIPRGGRFDLALCLEVAEHLSFDRARSFIAQLVKLSDTILFSAATPYQGGTNHINEQWPEFWAILFEAEGYICVDAVRDRVWYDDAVEWWYRQNTLLFVKRDSARHQSCIEHFGAHAVRGALSRVHPENLLFQVLHTFRTYRAAARAEEVGDAAAIFRAYADGCPALPRLDAVERARVSPGASDVFPATRMSVQDPEAILAENERVRDALRAAAAASEAELAERAAQLATTRALLTERQEQLDTTRALLTDRQEQLDTTRGLLTERQDHLDTTRVLLAERQEALQRLVRSLSDRDEQIAALHARAGTMAAHLLQLEHTVSEGEDQLVHARGRASECALRLDALNCELERTRAELLLRQSALAETEASLGAAEAELARKTSELDRIPRFIRRLFGIG